MAINLISKIKPKNNGAFPVYEDVDIKGGYQVRTDLTDRDNIPTLNRKEGMLVYVLNEEKYYTLIDGITNANWVEAQMGGGGITPGGDLSGTSTTQTVIGLNNLPLPAESPSESDMLIINRNILLSNSPVGMADDGTSIWIADYDNLNNDGTYGGLVRVMYGSDYISTRYDYPASLLPAVRPLSLAYFNGYLYATGEYNTYEGWLPGIAKIDVADGSVVESTFTANQGSIYTANGKLFLVEPDSGLEPKPVAMSLVYEVDPDTLATTPFNIPWSLDPGTCDFTYDSTMGKIWITCKYEDAILRLEPYTHEADFINYDHINPMGITYCYDMIWLVAEYMEDHAVYKVNTSNGDAMDVVDDYFHFLTNHKSLISYDSITDKVWCPTSGSSYEGMEFGLLVSINQLTMQIDGVARLSDISTYRLYPAFIIPSNNYMFVLYEGFYDGEVGALLRIDTSLVAAISDRTTSAENLPDEPWEGLDAEIYMSSFLYDFVQKNTYTITNAVDVYDYNNPPTEVMVDMKSEVILARPSGINDQVSYFLPQTPYDGEQHIFIDAEGECSDVNTIDIYDYQGTFLYSIDHPYGSITIVYFDDYSIWYGIAQWTRGAFTSVAQIFAPIDS